MFKLGDLPIMSCITFISAGGVWVFFYPCVPVEIEQRVNIE